MRGFAVLLLLPHAFVSSQSSDTSHSSCDCVAKFKLYDDCVCGWFHWYCTHCHQLATLKGALGGIPMEAESCNNCAYKSCDEVERLVGVHFLTYFKTPLSLVNDHVNSELAPICSICPLDPGDCPPYVGTSLIRTQQDLSEDALDSSEPPSITIYPEGGTYADFGNQENDYSVVSSQSERVGKTKASGFFSSGRAVALLASLCGLGVLVFASANFVPIIMNRRRQSINSTPAPSSAASGCASRERKQRDGAISVVRSPVNPESALPLTPATSFQSSDVDDAVGGVGRHFLELGAICTERRRSPRGSGSFL
jgi:hypothetical protein